MKQIFIFSFLTISAYFICPAQINANPGLKVEQDLPARLQTVNSQGAKEVVAQQPHLIVLDVRTPNEYAGGHLQSAHNLNYNAPDFTQKLAQLDKNKTYLVYCAVGGRSSKAAKIMEQMGFRKIYNVSEGFNSLKNAGLPVAK